MGLFCLSSNFTATKKKPPKNQTNFYFISHGLNLLLLLLLLLFLLSLHAHKTTSNDSNNKDKPIDRQETICVPLSSFVLFIVHVGFLKTQITFRIFSSVHIMCMYILIVCMSRMKCRVNFPRVGILHALCASCFCVLKLVSLGKTYIHRKHTYIVIAGCPSSKKMSYF